MATHWGISWGVSWGHSWDVVAPTVVTVGGRWKKGMEAIHRERHVQKKAYYPPNLDPGIKHSATILSRAGGYARAESLSPKQRSSIASTAAKARWK